MMGLTVEELELIEILKDFANGNTLVALYMTISFIRYILLPIYNNGKLVKGLCESLKKSLDDGVFGHREVVSELKSISETLKSLRNH